MEPRFVVAKIMGSPGKMIAYFFVQNCFKCDYDHLKVLSVIITIKVLWRLATHVELCDVRMCCVCN